MAPRHYFYRCYGIVCVIILGLLLTSCGVPMARGLKWLDTKTAQPEIDVSGIWNSPEWGSEAKFEQKGNEVTGTLGGYPVRGVVSGNRLYLLMYSGEKIHYSADLKTSDQNTLTGVYSKYSIIDDVINDPNDVGLVRPLTFTRIAEPK